MYVASFPAFSDSISIPMFFFFCFFFNFVSLWLFCFPYFQYFVILNLQ